MGSSRETHCEMWTNSAGLTAAGRHLHQRMHADMVLAELLAVQRVHRPLRVRGVQLDMGVRLTGRVDPVGMQIHGQDLAIRLKKLADESLVGLERKAADENGRHIQLSSHCRSEERRVGKERR